MENITRLTLMESKILELGRKQSERGPYNGSFTPGFIRKETEYSYRAINSALESLLSQELVEKTVSSTFRNGALVELDTYTITNDGIIALQKIESGHIKIIGGDQVTPQRNYETGTNARHWERRPQDYPPKAEKTGPANPDLAQTVKNLEAAVKAVADDLKAIHMKIDKLLDQPIPGSVTEKPEKKVPKTKPVKGGRMHHRAMVLEALETLGNKRKTVLAEDLKSAYIENCGQNGLSPKGINQFTAFLKRLQDEGVVTLKRVGCKNLGIKGHGSRVVVTITPDGREFLVKNS